MQVPFTRTGDDRISWSYNGFYPSSVAVNDLRQDDIRYMHACPKGPEYPTLVSRSDLDPVALGVCAHCGTPLA